MAIWTCEDPSALGCSSTTTLCSAGKTFAFSHSLHFLGQYKAELLIVSIYSSCNDRLVGRVCLYSNRILQLARKKEEQHLQVLPRPCFTQTSWSITITFPICSHGRCYWRGHFPGKPSYRAFKSQANYTAYTSTAPLFLADLQTQNWAFKVVLR